MSSLWQELKRRNVLRIGAAYCVFAWVLIQIAETIFPVFGFDETPTRIVVISLAVGFLPALALAWVFELTPEGIKRDSDVREESLSPSTAKMLDKVVIVVLVIGLVYFAIDKFILEPAREARSAARQAAEIEQARQQGRSDVLGESYGDPSIAVLAFEDMSPDGAQEYLSDGIAEELLTRLSRLPGLRVISRSSAFSYKGKNARIGQIAKDLNVMHVLDGSVRVVGNRVRITVQLIDALSDSHLWAKSYDRTLHDLFAVQDEIASSVLAELKVSLFDDVVAAEVTDPEAYALLLQARHLRQQASLESYAEAVELVLRTLEIDPDHAPAWVLLASIYSNQTNLGVLDRDDGYGQAREAAERALIADPVYGPAHDILGWIAINYDHNLSLAARHMELAMQLEPRNTAILLNSANLLVNLGRYDDAVTLNEFVVSRNPVDAVSHNNLGIYYLRAGRFDEALDTIRTTLRLSPDYVGAHYRMGLALLFTGEPEAALEAFTEEADEQYHVKGRALALHALGRQLEFEASLSQLIADWGERWPAEIAHVYAWIGDEDSAMQWLEKEFEAEGSIAPNNDGPYMYVSLKDNERFRELLELSGNLPAQLEAIEFEVTLPE